MLRRPLHKAASQFSWICTANPEIIQSDVRGKVLRIEYDGEPKKKKEGPPKLGVVHDPEGNKISFGQALSPGND